MSLQRLVSCMGLALGLGCGARESTPVGYAGPDVRAFIVRHRAALEGEIAVGSGSTLYDLSHVAGCQDVAALGRELHQRREQIFAAGPAAGAAPRGVDDAMVADRILGVMTDHPELRCVELELHDERVFAAGRRKVGGVHESGTPGRWR